MPRIKTFADGGSLTPADLNAVQMDSDSVQIWREHAKSSGRASLGGVDMSTRFGYFLGGSFTLANLGGTLVLGASSAFPINSEDGSRCRLRAIMVTNGIASTLSFQFGLYPITLLGTGGADSLSSQVTTTPMGGSTALLEEPPVLTTTMVLSGEFPAPQQGYYMIGATGSGTSPNGPVVLAIVSLEMKR